MGSSRGRASAAERKYYPTRHADKWVPDAGMCPCGKVRYYTRKDADKMARRLSFRNVSAYQCGDWWHFGHLPKAVRQGKIDRDTINPSKGTS